MLEDERLHTAHVNCLSTVVQVVLAETYLPKFVSALHSSLDAIAVLACCSLALGFAESEIEQRKTQLHHLINN